MIVYIPPTRSCPECEHCKAKSSVQLTRTESVGLSLVLAVLFVAALVAIWHEVEGLL